MSGESINGDHPTNEDQNEQDISAVNENEIQDDLNVVQDEGDLKAEENIEENEEEENEEEENEEEENIEENEEPYTPLSEEEHGHLLTKLQGFESEIQSLTVRLRSLSNAYHNKEQEVDAAKARIQRNAERQEAMLRGNVVKVLFEPLENLNRSIDMLEKAGLDEGQINGLKIVQKAFLDGFNTLGLEEIPGAGSRFNPNFHSALMNQPVEDPTLHEIVVNVYSTGYRIGEQILKPAQVIVGQYTAPPVVETQEANEEENTDDNIEEADVIETSSHEVISEEVISEEVISEEQETPQD